MPEVKRFRFEETIPAHPARVWEAMFSPETYPRWTAAFFEGSRFEGDWSEGSRILFLAPDGNGMVAEIAESRPHEFISIRHLGYVMDGVEDTESDEVRAWAPAYENYSFEAVPDGTRVVVDQDVLADHEDSMRDSWSKALAALKEICEGGAP
jgi:hypothetical protein